MNRPEPGEVIDGKYRVEAVLGEGGMGYVVQATHLVREAPVALKFLLPEVAEVPGLAKRFTNEAVAASALECENVIRVFDVGERDGSPYLVMEYLQGQELESEIRKGPFEVPRAVHIMLQVLRALSAAHAKAIIHRDLKPANVFLLEREGEEDFVKLLDFGVSKLERPDARRLTATGSGLGTPLYMSPEQARNAKAVDARTDIYAAGAMLYQMLTGRPPFEGDSLPELLSKVLLDAEPRVESFRSDLPDGLADVVHKALEKDLANRFQDAETYLRALLPYTDDRSAVIVARMRVREASARRSAVSIHPPPVSVEPAVGLVTSPSIAERPSVTEAQSLKEPPSLAESPPVPKTEEKPAATQQSFSATMQETVRAPEVAKKRSPLTPGMVIGGIVLAAIIALLAARSLGQGSAAATADSATVPPPGRGQAGIPATTAAGPDAAPSASSTPSSTTGQPAPGAPRDSR